MKNKKRLLSAIAAVLCLAVIGSAMAFAANDQTVPADEESGSVLDYAEIIPDSGEAETDSGDAPLTVEWEVEDADILYDAEADEYYVLLDPELAAAVESPEEPDELQNEEVEWPEEPDEILYEKSLFRGDNAPPTSHSLPYTGASDAGGIVSYTYTDYYFTGVTALYFKLTHHVNVGGTIGGKVRLFDMDVLPYGAYVTPDASSFTSAVQTTSYTGYWTGLSTAHRYFFRVQVDSRSLSGSTLIFTLQINNSPIA
ncbi:MAG: hypothetical protein LBT12_04240 [Oscillospiraceae bacterium]|jgi:hypothetical protein|nr:hypothetical protein [Oscillospiraceae bacterium]